MSSFNSSESIFDNEEQLITTRGAFSVGDVARVDAALTHMAPGLCSSNYKTTMSKLTIQNIRVDIRGEIALSYMLQNLAIKKSKWVQFFLHMLTLSLNDLMGL